MKVSAVIPTFNRRAYIKRAIDTVFAQTTPVDEVIIVDDERSTDCIEEAVELWYGTRVRVVKEGGGLSGARRRCVQEAKGEWIAFLDSDDVWTPDRNRLFLQAAAKVPSDVAWIFGNIRLVTDESDSTTLYEEYGLSFNEWPHVFADSISVQFPFQFGLLQGSFIRRSVLLELDCFREYLQHSEDVLAGFQVACRYRFAAIPVVVGSYYRTSDLTPNSAVLRGLNGPDYHRARMLAFEAVVRTGRRRPWNVRYAAEVRRYCKVAATTDKEVRTLARQQFRFGGISPSSVAFFCAALLGRRGIHMWNTIAETRRSLSLRSRNQAASARNGSHPAANEQVMQKSA
ncbi:MAG TPA: glycosyltransferase family 2 protein [Terriglobales bacterium]|nr:glycosyltransferase family 2 protein [Terriglobales bacterium]